MDLSLIKRLWINDLPPEENMHSMALFRRSFTLEEPLTDGVLYIAADSDFIAVLDGVELERGQFSDDPLQKSFTAVKLPELAAGKHLLALKVYYCGDDFATYSPGEPGLYIALESSTFTFSGDDVFKAIADPSFKARYECKLTFQLGFCTAYDLQKSVDWSSPDLDDSNWNAAVVLERKSSCIAQMRPAMPRPRLREFVPGKVIAAGSRQKLRNKADLTAAEKVDLSYRYNDNRTDYTLPCRIANPPDYGPETDGVWMLADLGYEDTGFIEFELDAPAGSIIYYAHGEHIDDGHVRCNLFYRNFVDTVIWQGGRRSFQLPFRRVGARYIELHVEFPGCGYAIEVFRVGLTPWRVNLPAAGTFECSDERLNTLYKNSLHTLELCMHDHYEDCPWREQALYTYDSRWQMIYGYYIWGNYDFAATSLKLFAPGQREDGHLRICAPGRGETIIAVYSLVWLNAVYEHYLYTGSKAVFEECRACADNIVKLIYERYDEAAGLLQEDQGKFWLFYEWCDGLNGRSLYAGKGFSAHYNIYGMAALEAYAQLAGDQQAADLASALRKRIREYFHVPEKQLYASRIVDGKAVDGFHEHTQALALLYDVATADEYSFLTTAILNDQCGIPASLSSLYISFCALDKAGADSRLIQEKLFRFYHPMLENNTGTLWETALGSRDFGYAGSLCHGWSALPVYAAKAMALGIKPLAPGWKKVAVKPMPGILKSATAVVPTPYGEIKVAMQSDDGMVTDLKIEHPDAIEIVR